MEVIQNPFSRADSSSNLPFLSSEQPNRARKTLFSNPKFVLPNEPVMRRSMNKKLIQSGSNSAFINKKQQEISNRDTNVIYLQIVWRYFDEENQHLRIAVDELYACLRNLEKEYKIRDKSFETVFPTLFESFNVTNEKLLLVFSSNFVVPLQMSIPSMRSILFALSRIKLTDLLLPKQILQIKLVSGIYDSNYIQSLNKFVEALKEKASELQNMRLLQDVKRLNNSRENIIRIDELIKVKKFTSFSTSLFNYSDGLRLNKKNRIRFMTEDRFNETRHTLTHFDTSGISKAAYFESVVTYNGKLKNFLLDIHKSADQI